MGSDTIRFIVFMVVLSLLSSIVVANGGSLGRYNSRELNALFRYYANRTLANHHRTGTLSRVSLPSNISGMEVSVVRLRGSSLWGRGINSKFVKIPPSVRTSPYVKRLAMVYDNLGNWSSKYYHVPGYSLVSPVIGFEVYDYTDLTVGNLALNVTGGSISIRFPYLKTKEKNVTRLKCIGFRNNGSVEFKNVTERDVCVTENTGHFCVMIPYSSPPSSPSMPQKKGRVWKWWVIEFGLGAVGLAVLVTAGVAVSRWWRKRKIKDMEKESDSSVALDTFWVRGDLKMPCASMIRTQPALEHDYVP
ncbi:Detected protein of unknown function [Hibiscus syriacus]|uniref:Uncharacterized protein n=1 Tax=Hibiscus syriacus TaxID=106335 RepID=A0A6A3C4J1_HIBSY|nr:uncharacterized protein LOC120205607 [Hibiscus syriacus]KAE8723287.1 Detected protein of unknown function [Hibiscus syriacus]